MLVTVVAGKQGRVVLPAEVRAALGVRPGDRLHLHLSGRLLVVRRPEDAVQARRSLASNVPSGRSLVDELLAQRRIEASAG